MAWKECDRMSQREEFTALAVVPGANFSELCRRFGISRKTGYKWRRRYQANPDAPLSDRSRRPTRSPGKTSDLVEQRVLEIRDAHPAWGGRKIRKRMQNLGDSEVPSASTIAAIVKRHGRVSPQESQKRRAFCRFQRATANELWQVDFKGEFKLLNKKYCHPLTVLDDHSRFSLGIAACGNQRRQTVQSHFRKIFGIYGLPDSIYVDNGNPWASSSNALRYTRFSAWLLRHGVEVIFGRPYHPQGRGKLERFHRTLKLEVLQGRSLKNLKEAQACFDPWRDVYNLQRPHEALDLATPAEHYQVSPRKFVEQRGVFEYNDRFEVRRANRVGQFGFGGHTYRISEAFRDQPIGLSATKEDGVWDVWYCRFVVGRLNQRTQKIERHQPRG